MALLGTKERLFLDVPTMRVQRGIVNREMARRLSCSKIRNEHFPFLRRSNSKSISSFAIMMFIDQIVYEQPIDPYQHILPCTLAGPDLVLEGRSTRFLLK